jgi:phenylalanine-4-hydroxylase
MAHRVPYRNFTPEEHETWKVMFERQVPKRDQQIFHLFSEGIRALGIDAERVPDIEAVNAKLKRLTGFEGVPVVGLEEDQPFYQMLGERQFPIGNFIRDRKDVSYTPAPDVFHDLYGHLPFLADRDYADFCAELGRRATKVGQNSDSLKQWARLFWFAVEFSLIKTPVGNRIFGAGIASSYGECEYALSTRPEILPFDLETIRLRDFRVDEFQRTIFLMESTQQIYGCLDEFERRVNSGR